MKVITLILTLLISVQLGYSADTTKVTKELHQTGTIGKLIDYPAKQNDNSELKSTSQLNYCDYVDCKIYAQDFSMQYLGITSQNQYNQESIINDYGNYGSRYSSTSIRNSFSSYGSSFSSYSAYNSFAQYPPILYKLNGITQQWEKVAYLTKNAYLNSGIYPRVDPDILINALESGFCLPPPLIGLPDIQISNINIEESSFSIGDSVTMHFTVLNNSIYSINTTFYIDVWQDLSIIKTYFINTMAPLGYAEGVLKIKITKPIHVLGIYSDITNNVLESIESNNNRALYLYANLPDLIINNITLKPKVDSVNVEFNIKNIGLTNVNDTVSILLQNNGKQTIYHTKLNLSANASILLHKNIVANQDTNKVFIVLDYFNNITELNELNNIGYNYILMDLNQPPAFTTSPITSAAVDEEYTYNITAHDINGDALSISAPTKPEWLAFTDYGNGTALLSGIPSNSNIGTNTLKLRVNDGTISTDQDFIITVTEQVKPQLSILQEVISSGGDYSIKSGGSISYTFGETIIETFKGSNIMLTQGFQQTNLMINSLDESHELNFEISAFPNPFAEYVNLRIVLDNLSGLQYLLYDLNGKLLLQKQIENTETEIPFYDLSPAGYILKVTYNNKELKSFKIVKTH